MYDVIVRRVVQKLAHHATHDAGITLLPMSLGHVHCESHLVGASAAINVVFVPFVPLGFFVVFLALTRVIFVAVFVVVLGNVVAVAAAAAAGRRGARELGQPCVVDLVTIAVALLGDPIVVAPSLGGDSVGVATTAAATVDVAAAVAVGGGIGRSVAVEVLETATTPAPPEGGRCEMHHQ